MQRVEVVRLERAKQQALGASGQAGASIAAL